MILAAKEKGGNLLVVPKFPARWWWARGVKAPRSLILPGGPSFLVYVSQGPVGLRGGNAHFLQESPLLGNSQEASLRWEVGYVCLLFWSLFRFTIFLINIRMT